MKKLFFSLLAVAAMASCSKSELAERPNIDGGDVEILAKSTALSISTRAPFEGSTIDATHNLVAITRVVLQLVAMFLLTMLASRIPTR